MNKSIRIKNIFNLINFSRPDIFLILLWTFVLFWYFLFEESFVPLQSDFLLQLIIFLLSFYLCYKLFAYTLFSSKVYQLGSFSIKPFLSKNFLYATSILFICLSIIKVNLVIHEVGFSSASEFRNITTGSEGEEDTRSLFIGISFPLAIVAYYISLKGYDQRFKNFFLLASLFLAIVSTAKIFLLLWIFYVCILNKEKITLKIILFFLGLSILFFSLSSILLDKYSSSGDGNLVLAIFDTFNVYLLGGIASFQQILAGEHSGDGWTSIGNWSTNVHTAFAGWYIFFGYNYCVICGSLLGAYYSFFNNCKLLNKSFEIYSIFLLYCLFMTLFADQYFPALKMHAGYLFCSVLASFIELTKSKER